MAGSRGAELGVPRRVHPRGQARGPRPQSPPCPLQGFSAHWWNFRHFQHHAKPNIFHKDPDVTVAPVFLLGESSVEVCGKDVDSLVWASGREAERSQAGGREPWPQPSVVRASIFPSAVATESL